MYARMFRATSVASPSALITLGSLDPRSCSVPRVARSRFMRGRRDNSSPKFARFGISARCVFSSRCGVKAVELSSIAHFYSIAIRHVNAAMNILINAFASENNERLFRQKRWWRLLASRRGHCPHCPKEGPPETSHYSLRQLPNKAVSFYTSFRRIRRSRRDARYTHALHMNVGTLSFLKFSTWRTQLSDYSKMGELCMRIISNIMPLSFDEYFSFKLRKGEIQASHSSISR